MSLVKEIWDLRLEFDKAKEEKSAFKFGEILGKLSKIEHSSEYKESRLGTPVCFYSNDELRNEKIKKSIENIEKEVHNAYLGLESIPKSISGEDDKTMLSSIEKIWKFSKVYSKVLNMTKCEIFKDEETSLKWYKHLQAISEEMYRMHRSEWFTYEECHDLYDLAGMAYSLQVNTFNDGNELTDLDVVEKLF